MASPLIVRGMFFHFLLFEHNHVGQFQEVVVRPDVELVGISTKESKYILLYRFNIACCQSFFPYKFFVWVNLTHVGCKVMVFRTENKENLYYLYKKTWGASLRPMLFLEVLL